MKNFNKFKEWFKSLSTIKKILLVISVIILIGITGNNKSGKKNDSNFYGKHFVSSSGTAFGQSGYNRVIFEEDGGVEYCNMWKASKNKDAEYHPSNMTKGTWKFIDNEKRKIDVIFTSGNNMDKAGTWEFTENYQKVKLPGYTANSISRILTREVQ